MCGQHCTYDKDFVTLIIKVVDYCNFECSFCRFYLNREELHSSLSIETFTTAVEKAVEYNTKRGINHLTLIFHGGEPLLWGRQNFDKAIELEKKIIKEYEGFRFVNNIQTNGSLIDYEWVEFFKANNFSIGLSLDGPDEINFHRSSVILPQKVLENIKILNDNHCKYGILSVITNEHRGKAKEYYDFLCENDIHSVGFCYCFDSNGKNIVTNEVLTDFLIEFFKYYFYGDFRLHVREFEFVSKLTLNARVVGCTFDNRKSCGNYFTLFPNGDIHFCDSYSLDDNPLGNIHTESFEMIKKNDRLKHIIDRAINTFEEKCKQCSINNLCAGGCYRHVLDSGYNAFCDTFKILYPYISKTVLQTKEKIEKDRKEV